MKNIQIKQNVKKKNIDEAIAIFDQLIEKVNAKNVENQKVHFKSIAQDLENQGKALIEKINKL